MLNCLRSIEHCSLCLKVRSRARQLPITWSRNKRIEYPPTPKLTMKDVKQCYMKIMNLPVGYQEVPQNREHLLQYTPKLEDLPPRSMQDSFTDALIPLSQDIVLRDRYASHLGNLRISRIIEDMDFFAGWICLQHLHLPALPAGMATPYTFVTILVDKMIILERITDVKKDVRLSGHVSWVGRSSLEVVVWVEQMEENKPRAITRALFLMAARNAINTSAVNVNPIAPATEEEKKILSGGEDRKRKRLEIQANSLFTIVPNEREQLITFEIYKRTKSKNTIMLNERVLPKNGRWLSEWRTITTIAPNPENRNVQHTVFGGFLMRQMLENSSTCAYFYFADSPSLICICDINFTKPVPVNSFIKMTSYVLFTEGEYALLLTVADVLCAIRGIQITSNSLYAVYKAQKIIHEIYPQTYEESLWYLQGHRIFRNAMEYIEKSSLKKSL